MSGKLIIIGAGGHGKSVLDAAIKSEKYNVIGFLDDTPDKDEVLGFPRLGYFSDIDKYADNHMFVCAVGDNSIRVMIDASVNVEWAVIIHPSANIGMGVNIGDGSVVMGGTVINSSAQIGRHCVINSGAVVEHDCAVLDYSHISPNATLCGKVKIGRETWIGAGATVRDGISIAERVTVGAGSVLVKNINEAGTYVGLPARRIS
jgi:sugar O-acyltransferase (sialic acid O-acetyltransferase NeuD family)